jgi:hypothetical protein
LVEDSNPLIWILIEQKEVYQTDLSKLSLLAGIRFTDVLSAGPQTLLRALDSNLYINSRGDNV